MKPKVLRNDVENCCMREVISLGASLVSGSKKLSRNGKFNRCHPDKSRDWEKRGVKEKTNPV